MRLQLCLFCITANPPAWWEAVRWLSKDVWKTKRCCISLFCPTFCRNTMLQCVYAQRTGCCISGGELPQWTSFKLMFLIFAKLPFPELLVLLHSLNETMTLSGSSITTARKINCSAQKTELMVQRLPSTARCLFAAESWKESKKRRQMRRKLSWLTFIFLIYKNET